MLLCPPLPSPCPQAKILARHLNRALADAAAEAAEEGAPARGPSEAAGMAAVMGWGKEERGVVRAPGRPRAPHACVRTLTRAHMPTLIPAP